MQIIVK